MLAGIQFWSGWRTIYSKNSTRCSTSHQFTPKIQFRILILWWCHQNTRSRKWMHDFCGCWRCHLSIGCRACDRSGTVDYTASFFEQASSRCPSRYHQACWVSSWKVRRTTRICQGKSTCQWQSRRIFLSSIAIQERWERSRTPWARYEPEKHSKADHCSCSVSFSSVWDACHVSSASSRCRNCWRFAILEWGQHGLFWRQTCATMHCTSRIPAHCIRLASRTWACDYGLLFPLQAEKGRRVPEFVR